MRASGGNRTHNPRITNAVLCQLKLRWPDGDGKKRSRSVKIQPPGTPHSSAPNPQESRVCRQKPGQITKKRKKVGPLTRQEHPVLAVRVRGRRPYDRSDRRPHFKIAVGWGPESPIAFQDMHPACHIRSPGKIFHLERAWPRQANGWISAIAAFFDFFWAARCPALRQSWAGSVAAAD